MSEATGAVEFGAAVSPLHRRIDADQYDEIYVVGDVHGCLDELRRLWTEMDPGEGDCVIFVGDLVRKGPASREVVEFVRDRDNATSVRGNNEAKVLNGEVSRPGLDPVREYIESLPVALSWDGGLVVHGGVDPTRPLASHGVEDLLETRSIPAGNGYDGPFWFEQYEGPPRVFFGHTVLDDPVDTQWAVGLDTGCVYGGSLTALATRSGEWFSVDAAQTHQQRADRKIVDPTA
ncbi:serine/threonine protein phosphatase 1 [Halorientalis persicus]|jgi:serine/threonine protein phosphatase 1|uniref:Serine/threonine protein phosphatase 1 n=1 Tax=Halorientalis persicus TaxID=1367881 RepID=A0A1H8DTP0_9EURY|nr:metallophosphoesterase family protein [Halorientalis persicus]SEN09907.1 serine/threonine protein phosphatase 1 [Halorientalis persicus]